MQGHIVCVIYGFFCDAENDAIHTMITFTYMIKFIQHSLKCYGIFFSGNKDIFDKKSCRNPESPENLPRKNIY